MPIKILIVDDNETNRIVLRGIVENFAEDNGRIFMIDEAANGLEAVAMHLHTPYHLIFMDIMMPMMDGVEACYRIRKNDSKALIIAVSAIDDNDRKKIILSKGAEDYVSKPINIDILYARMHNYLSLLDNRFNKDIKRFNTIAWNLFTNQILNYRGLFFIRNEEDLAQFWEYYLSDNTFGSEELIEAVSTLYSIGSICLQKSIFVQIIVEISDNFTYFTMSGIGQLASSDIHTIAMKTSIRIDYKTDHEKISIKIARITKFNSPDHKRVSEPLPKQSTEETAIDISQQPHSLSDSNDIQVYNYFDPHDFEDIKTDIAALNSLMLIVSNGDIEITEVEEIIAYLEQIGNIATIYSESFSIAYALKNLAYVLSIHSQEFIENSKNLGILCSAFAEDLNSWIRVIFVEGATSVNYMDDMIISNAQMITNFLNQKSTAATASEINADLDDVFNF
ncbi:MAG: response regulator [Sulfuricurvum sp.]|nr:response regulator [Sulfuricurvum sp.]